MKRVRAGKGLCMYLSVGECYLCRELAPETRDHVVPVCLFPDPRPSNLLTLPCCRNCQVKFSKDEEYFRDFISATSSDKKGSRANEIWQKTRRSLKRSQSKNREFRKRLEQVDIVSPAGIFLGKRLTLSAEDRRLGNVIEKIGRGLHADITGVSAPPDWKRIVYPLGQPTKIPEELLIPNLVIHYDGVFACRGGIAVDAPTSVWLMQFFDKQIFWIVLHDPNYHEFDGVK